VKLGRQLNLTRGAVSPNSALLTRATTAGIGVSEANFPPGCACIQETLVCDASPVLGKLVKQRNLESWLGNDDPASGDVTISTKCDLAICRCAGEPRWTTSRHQGLIA
jgi:hypothetical protein